MNLHFSITDKDSGKVLFEGLVTSYDVTIGIYEKSFNFRGIEECFLRTIPKKVYFHSNERIDMDSRDQIMAPCDHQWKKYVGITESYDYCEKCPEKRGIHPEPSFKNTYERDSWRSQS